ncbi:MAG: propionyl-CoA synthetase [Pseudomonadota bacterium]
MSYADVRQRWRRDPEAFWAEAATGIDWVEPWTSVLEPSQGAGRWFPGARLNTCYNAVDRHADGGRGDQPALLFESTMTGRQETYTYSELQTAVARLAGAMQRSGVVTGDRVLIYMPMVPEAAFAVLACARIGAVHSVVFGGFAAREVATRIDDATPKLIISASCGLEPGRTVFYKPLLDDAIDLARHTPERHVVLQREEQAAELNRDIDLDWHEFQDGAEPADCVPVAATDPLYLLYTSGTTGQPKGIVRDNGGHAVALHWSMKAIYDIDAGDTFWAASDIGWVVGHSYIIYAPLLRGATTVMFEGKPVGTPDAGVFWRIIERHRVKALFTAPTAIRAIRREDPDGEFIKASDLSHFTGLFVAGERCDPPTLNWAGEQLGVPVIDHWWQTETGWSVAGNTLGAGLVDIRPGSAGKPMPGWDVQVVDPEGEPVPAGDTGAIVVRLPLGPGALAGLWQAEDRFQEAYLTTFPGYYETGDAGYLDEEGYLYVMTRTDDIINVAGHRLSTGAIEEVIALHPAVAECAVTGIKDKLKGQLPMGFICTQADSSTDPQTLIDECVALVRQHVGAVAAFKRAVVVKRLPKTRSGKILRGTLAKIADGEPYSVPATIDDPEILNEISTQLRHPGNPSVG